MQNDHYNFVGIDPQKGPIAVSLKSNSNLPESISDQNMRNKKRTLNMRRTSSVKPRSPEIGKRSSVTTIELEIIISFLTGSEYHKISTTFNHRVTGVPAYKDMIKTVKPELNLETLQHVPTKESVHMFLQYHDFK